MTAAERTWQREFKGEAATTLLQTISSYLDSKTDPYARQATIINSSGTGKLLAQFVDPRGLLDHHKDGPQRPLVIFAFDKAHILTDNPPITNRSTKWNLFSELRLILRQTSEHALFSLFLSMAECFNLFSPEICSYPVGQI
jgi:hypothetical protein